MNRVYAVAAKRTPVANRNGTLKHIGAWQLGAAVINAALVESAIQPTDVDAVVMGNALYAGGNPARLAALEAGLPPPVPAQTVDTQCCSGLDAIISSARIIQSGSAQIVVAGGLESYSRAPQRARKVARDAEHFEPYDRPPFSPWPQRDPDMLESAAQLAAEQDVSRDEQARYAILSHRKALECASNNDEIVSIGEIDADSFTRRLDERICQRAGVVAGNSETGLTNATIAIEADAAAVVVLVSESVATRLNARSNSIEFIEGQAVGCDPASPALAPIAATRALLDSQNLGAGDLSHVELMEAFAVQAMVCERECKFDSATVNRGGGALARGHPIGASGAILAVRLWHEMQVADSGDFGLATIAAAGGLGTAALWRKC
ncbi:MAG: thiolase family protein [Pseudomonadota bacterium]